MRELKYPPGVRFVFLVALSMFTAVLIVTFEGGQFSRDAGWKLSTITTLMSLAVFVVALLPWAKNRRKRTLLSGLALFLSGTPFLIAEISSTRVDGFYFPHIILLACFMIYQTQHGSVPNHQRRPVGVMGYILLGLTFLITPVLTILKIYLVKETNATELLFLTTPAWLLFSGIMLKIAGAEKKHLAPIKPLLFSGELSILFSFPLIAFLVIAESARGSMEDILYAVAIGLTILFSQGVLLRGLLGNWLCNQLFDKPENKASAVDGEHTELPPLIATAVSKPEMFLSNYKGFAVLGGFALLGMIGFVIGSLVGAGMFGASLQGGLMGMASAIWAPFGFVLSFSLFGGIAVLGWLIYHTQKYWHTWVGLILLLLALPFLFVLAEKVIKSVFVKPTPALVVAEDEPEFMESVEEDEINSLYADMDLEDYMENPPGVFPGHDPSKLIANYGIQKTQLAVLRGNLDLLKTLLGNGAIIDQKDEAGNTPLHLALGLGETEIAEWLVSQGSDLQAKANDSRTLVHAAAAGGQLEFLQQLSAKGHKLNAKTELGQLPLHFACATGQAETVEWLLAQGQSIRTKDLHGNTPLHLALIHGRVGLVESLLDAGADLKQANTAGMTAIHLACATGQVGLVNWMLKKDNALVNLPDTNRFTPLYHAAINGNSRTVALLLSHKAEITAGDNAELGGLFAKVLQDDVTYFERFVEQMNPFGGMGMMGMMNPMMMGMNPYGMPGMMGTGIGNPFDQTEQLEEETEDGVPTLEERRALVQADAHGNTALHLVAAIGSSGMVEAVSGIPGFFRETKNRLGLNAYDLAEALDRDEGAASKLYEGTADMMMGMMNPMMMAPRYMQMMMGSPQPGAGGTPGVQPGMDGPMMNPYGMPGMPGMGMQTVEGANKEEMDLFPPLKEPLDLLLTESELLQLDQQGDLESSRDASSAMEADIGGKGRFGYADQFSDAEEKPLGTDPNDPNMVPGMPYGMVNPNEIMGTGYGMNIETNRVGLTARDELSLRSIMRKRASAGGNPRSFYERIVTGSSVLYLRHKITGLFDHATDPLTGYSALKWMELLNHNVETPQDSNEDLSMGMDSYGPMMGGMMGMMNPYGMPGMMPGMMGMGIGPYGMDSPRSPRPAHLWFEDSNSEDNALQRQLLRREEIVPGFRTTGQEPLLHRLAREGNKFLLAFIMNYDFEPNITDHRGMTALHVAAAHGRTAMINTLLEMGADLAAVDEYGFTALHWAAQYGHLGVVRHLVEQTKAKRVADLLNRTPTEVARSRGHTAVSQYLNQQ